MLHIVDLRAVDSRFTLLAKTLICFRKMFCTILSKALLLASPPLAIGVILSDTAMLKALFGKELGCLKKNREPNIFKKNFFQT